MKHLWIVPVALVASCFVVFGISNATFVALVISGLFAAVARVVWAVRFS